MLHQSFTTDTLKRILDYENRKGIYLEKEYFPDIHELNLKIKEINSDIKGLNMATPTQDLEIRLNALNEEKESLKKERIVMLDLELSKIAKTLTSNNFKLTIQKINRTPVFYTIRPTIQNFFALRQVQFDFKRFYKIQQSSSPLIVGQIKVLLNNTFPKFVIRIDFKDFYESIPQSKLISKLNEENLLDFYSKRLVFQILKQYSIYSGSDVGIPRGVGISAYLAELYLRDFDHIVKSMPNLVYYARYVDDIVIVFTPRSSIEPRNYLAEITAVAGTQFGLLLNPSKTKAIDLIDIPRRNSFEYLGYNISFGDASDIKLALSQKKILKYKVKIKKSFDDYIANSRNHEKKARKLLVKRIRFLTGNTRLANNKSNILVGIYYSNNHLSDTSGLINLDHFLNRQIQTRIRMPQLQTRLNRYSFIDGFNTKRFSNFKSYQLADIIKIWRSV